MHRMISRLFSHESGLQDYYSGFLKSDLKFVRPQPDHDTVKPVLMATCIRYSETTCIKRPLCDVPKVSTQYILTCIQRPALYKQGRRSWGAGGAPAPPIFRLGGQSPPNIYTL